MMLNLIFHAIKKEIDLYSNIDWLAKVALKFLQPEMLYLHAGERCSHHG